MTNETFIIRNKDGKWEFNTTNSNSIDFKTLVSETIPQGKENAIELLNLSVMLETPPKIVKQAILELIMSGEPICTNDYNLYWKSEIPQEINRISKSKSAGCTNPSAARFCAGTQTVRKENLFTGFRYVRNTLSVERLPPNPLFPFGCAVECLFCLFPKRISVASAYRFFKLSLCKRKDRALPNAVLCMAILFSIR